MAKNLPDLICSLDIETTHLDPDRGQVLAIGAALVSLSLGRVVAEYEKQLDHSSIVGDPFALDLNKQLIRNLHVRPNGVDFIRPEDVALDLKHWLLSHGVEEGEPVTFAGKNFGTFDLQWLKRLDRFDELIKYRHRIIDPAMLWWEPDVDGSRLPDSKRCKERARLAGEVHHTALADALDTANMILKWVKLCA